jgi:hypothetical protein
MLQRLEKQALRMRASKAAAMAVVEEEVATRLARSA